MILLRLYIAILEEVSIIDIVHEALEPRCVGFLEKNKSRNGFKITLQLQKRSNLKNILNKWEDYTAQEDSI